VTLVSYTPVRMTVYISAFVLFFNVCFLQLFLLVMYIMYPSILLFPPPHSESLLLNYHTVFFSGDVVAESHAFIIIFVPVALLVANSFLVPALHAYKQLHITEVDWWAAACVHKAICCLIEP
jgi:hypothetical protein